MATFLYFIRELWRSFGLVGYCLWGMAEDRISDINGDPDPAKNKTYQLGGIKGFVKERNRDEKLQGRSDVLQKPDSRKLQTSDRGAEA